jgi:hypothetical protein
MLKPIERSVFESWCKMLKYSTPVDHHGFPRLMSAFDHALTIGVPPKAVPIVACCEAHEAGECAPGPVFEISRLLDYETGFLNEGEVHDLLQGVVNGDTSAAWAQAIRETSG